MPHNDLNLTSFERNAISSGQEMDKSDDEQVSEPIRKKQKTSLTGYESDSSDDQESDTETVSALKPEQKAVKNATEDDMFAIDEIDEASRAASDGKDSDRDQYDEEPINNSPETHLPSDGEIQVEAFNILEEREKGRFDEAGNYIPADEDDEDAIQDQDLWINDAKDVQKAKTSQKLAETSKRRENQRAQQSARHYMIDEALLRFYFFLFDQGTIVDSLAKLNKRRGTGDQNVLNSINYISDLINILEQKGIDDVYLLKRSDVAALYKEECLSESAFIENYKSLIWAFKWSNKPSQVHGPYSNYQMQYWKQSYFKNNVAVRFQDDPDKPENWLDLDSIIFM